jgi:hypothetical protein
MNCYLLKIVHMTFCLRHVINDFLIRQSSYFDRGRTAGKEKIQERNEEN